MRNACVLTNGPTLKCATDAPTLGDMNVTTIKQIETLARYVAARKLTTARSMRAK